LCRAGGRSGAPSERICPYPCVFVCVNVCFITNKISQTHTHTASTRTHRASTPHTHRKLFFCIAYPPPQANTLSGTARPPHNYFLQDMPPPRANTLSGTECQPQTYFLQDMPPPQANTLSGTECQGLGLTPTGVRSHSCKRRYTAMTDAVPHSSSRHWQPVRRSLNRRVVTCESFRARGRPVWDAGAAS